MCLSQTVGPLISQVILLLIPSVTSTEGSFQVLSFNLRPHLWCRNENFGPHQEGGSFFNDLTLHESASLLQAASDIKLQVFAVLVCPGAPSFFPPHLAASPGSCEPLHDEVPPNCFMLLSWIGEAHKCELQWEKKIRLTVSSRKYLTENLNFTSGFMERRLPL